MWFVVVLHHKEVQPERDREEMAKLGKNVEAKSGSVGLLLCGLLHSEDCS